ncbi:MAG: hypothetical protein NVS4B9_26910 [Ktedonobacteraceae bacterium]
MQNVVPDALQRLRATDIIRMAGLSVASLGQEYSRIGSFHETKRQGARISGMLEIPPAAYALAAWDKSEMVPKAQEKAEKHLLCSLEVEIKNISDWTCHCSCGSPATMLCAHATALLYYWLARPAAFNLIAVPPEHDPVQFYTTPLSASSEMKTDDVSVDGVYQSQAGAANSITIRYSADLSNMLMQLGLSELRGIAREYELVINGMTKSQLVEKLVETLKQPEAVRRVAATLEKTQRQLLAALTLAGGVISDEDLRSLFERFSLGQPSQLQRVLLILQGKALLFRTSMSSYTTLPTGSVGGALLDVGWYVPVEARLSLRVSVPVTSFDVEQQKEKHGSLGIRYAEPYRVLADLLLVGRALDGYVLGPDDNWSPRSPGSRSSESSTYSRAVSGSDRSVQLPAPEDTPSPVLIEALQAVISRPTGFLRFAVRFLRLLNLAYKDETGKPVLRVLQTSASFLLGSPSMEILRDLFNLWLHKASYSDLFDLQSDGLRLCCRAAPLGIPILRADELDVENSEARQMLASLLAQTPIEQWISFQAFARFVYRLDPLFLQKRQRLFSSPHWWFEQEAKRPLKPLQLNDWLRAEMLYIAHLLAGPLHWWGACDIALSPEGRLLAFRLTPLASWLLNGQAAEPVADDEAQDDAETLHVMSKDEVLAPCSVAAWPVIDILETYMQPAGVQHDLLRYRLTPAALSSALGRGLRPARLVELLRSLPADEAREPGLLAQLLGQLEQWIASYGRVRIYTGVKLLETTDAMVMRELSATTSLETHIVQSVHPNLLVLKKAAFESVIDELKKRGQSPLLHDEDFNGPE